MKIVKTLDYKEMSYEAYQIVAKVLEENKSAVINTTTGASYDGLFERMVEAINKGELNIEEAVIMNLDEYIADRDKPFTVYSYMHQKLYGLINQRPKVIELIDGSLEDSDSEIARYAKVLSQYPRDLQIVGLGVNGHLGANEPGASFDSRIFRADSHESTIQSTMLYHRLSRDEAPTQMITLGLADIMEARKILLVASGERKALAAKQTIEGPIDEECPASLLRTHPDVTFVIDSAAASLLTE